MARKHESRDDYDTRVIEEEIDRHQRAYELAQERYGYSTSHSGEKTMRKHDILGEALASYLRTRREQKAYRTKLSDIRDLVEANLKRVDEGWKDGDLKGILQHIRHILDREE